MKKFNLKIVSRTCVSALLAAALFSCNSNDPKVGDVWRYRPKSSNENPFRETSKLRQFYDYKVIDVKDGYVLYMDLSDSTKKSSTIRMFKASAERLSGCR
jgi:hypothetical protein